MNGKEKIEPIKLISCFESRAENELCYGERPISVDAKKCTQRVVSLFLLLVLIISHVLFNLLVKYRGIEDITQFTNWNKVRSFTFKRVLVSSYQKLWVIDPREWMRWPVNKYY